MKVRSLKIFRALTLIVALGSMSIAQAIPVVYEMDSYIYKRYWFVDEYVTGTIDNAGVFHASSARVLCSEPGISDCVSKWAKPVEPEPNPYGEIYTTDPERELHLALLNYAIEQMTAGTSTGSHSENITINQAGNVFYKVFSVTWSITDVGGAVVTIDDQPYSPPVVVTGG